MYVFFFLINFVLVSGSIVVIISVNFHGLDRLFVDIKERRIEKNSKIQSYVLVDLIQNLFIEGQIEVRREKIEEVNNIKVKLKIFMIF